MNTRIFFIALFFAATICLGSSVAANAQSFDLSVRQAIYFAGNDESGKDLETMPSGTPNHPLELKDSQALSCGSKTCKFNLGVIVWRDAGKGSLTKDDFSTYGNFQTPDGGSIGNSFTFHYAGKPSVEFANFVMGG